MRIERKLKILKSVKVWIEWVSVQAALWLVLAVAFMLPYTAQAQPQDDATKDDVPESTDITVTGYRIARPSDMVMSITPVSAKTIDLAQKLPSQRIESILRLSPAFTQFRRSDARSANATSQGVTVRGLGGNASSRVLITLDGVPQSDPFGGWVTWPAYNTLTLQQVQMLPGGGRVVAGPGALGGLIEMDSTTANNGMGRDQRHRTQFVIEGGSRGSVEASAAHVAKLGGGYAVLGAGYARSDGFIPIIAAQRGPADKPAPYRQWNVSGRAVIPFDAATEMQANLLVFSDQRSRGLDFTDNGGRGANASLRLVHTGDWGVQATGWLQMRQFKSEFSSVDAARAVVTPTLDQYNVPSTGLGAQIELHPPVGTGYDVSMGADVRHVSGQTHELFTFVNRAPTRLREAGGAAQTYGLYAEAKRVSGDVTLTGSARVDHWRLNKGRLTETQLSTGASIRNDRAADRSGWQPTGRLTALFERDDVSLTGAVYRSWRLPTLNELYRPFRLGADATAANAALDPETLIGGDVTLQARWTGRGQGSLGVTGFINRMRNPIANVTLGTGPAVFPGVGFLGAGGSYRQRQNLDAITSKGVEAFINQRFGEFWLEARYAFTEATVKASARAAPLNGLTPAQVPRHGAYLAAKYWGDKVSFGANLRYTSSQFEDDVNTRRLKSAMSVDADAEVKITPTLAAFARVENIGNARIEAGISATGIIERATPRSVWIGLRYRE
jgi:vitamin B12 transporter